MTRGKIAAIGLLVVLAAGAAVAAQMPPLFSNNPDDYVMKEANDAYNSGVRDGVAKRAAGDLKGALLAFSGAASNGNIAEIPNYRVWIDMADLYCRLGKRKQGLAMAQEYDCATEVMAGHKRCWVDENDPAFLIPNPKISPLCYAQACNPAIITGETSPEIRAFYRKQRMMISRVRAECGR